MLQWIEAKSGRRKAHPRGAISQRLAAYTLLHREELRAALQRRLESRERLLRAVNHNLHRSQVHHRRVLADRKRLLELLDLLEEENRELRRRLEEGGGGG